MTDPSVSYDCMPSANMFLIDDRRFVSVLNMDNIATWKALAISSGIALLVAVLVQFLLVPVQRRKIMGQPVHFTFGDSDGNYPLFSLKCRINSATRLLPPPPHPTPHAS